VIAALAVIVLVAPVFLLGAFVSRTVRADVQERSETDRLQAVDLAAALISSRMESAAAALQLLTGRRSLLDSMRDEDGESLHKHLTDLRTIFPDYSVAALFDAGGAMLMADPLVPGELGRDFSHHDYFAGAMQSSDPYLSEVFAIAAGPTPHAVSVSLAVRDGSGVLGLMMIGLSPAQLLTPLQPLGGLSDREILVADWTGRVIASTNPARPPTTKTGALSVDFARFQRGSIEFKDGTTDRVATYTRIPGGDWTLVVIDDPAVVFAAERRLEGAVLGASRMAGAAALVLGVAIAALYLALARQRRQLAASNAALQSANSELVASQVTLAATNAQLDAANGELEAFAYSVSHDLRSPLRAIDGFSRILVEDHREQLGATASGYLTRVRENATRMGQLIDDLLTFSRLSRQPLTKRPVDVRQLVDEALRDVQPHREPPVELTIGDLPPCEADRTLLRQVYVNLLANAFKFTSKREHARIDVGCTSDGARAVYFVRDNGAGFDMKYASKLFGVFQRLHRADEYEGTGVGLAIVQRVVHRHGGRVWVEAALDAGAAFYFTLEPEV
jgi:signal transduction histidine kinase